VIVQILVTDDDVVAARWQAPYALLQRGRQRLQGWADVYRGVQPSWVFPLLVSITTQDYEAEVKRVSERFDELPRTVGVRPAQNPPEPEDTSAQIPYVMKGRCLTRS
jgi:hypothetical protein